MSGPAAAPHRPLLAVFWMLAAIASFALMAVSGREAQAEMNVFELMVWRSGLGLLIVVALMGRSVRAQARTAVPGLHLKRNAAHFGGQTLWFTALTLLPLGQMVAIEFTNPILVAVLAPLMLGEGFTARKALAVTLGFAGVLVVARPDAAALTWGHVAALVAAFAFALNTIYTRQIMSHDGVLTVLFWMTLSQGALGAVLGAPGGIPVPSAAMLPWIIALGLTGLSGHYALTSALRHAPASVVAPMDFLRLPVMVTVGAMLYAEPMESGVIAGGAMILAANLINLRGARPRPQSAA